LVDAYRLARTRLADLTQKKTKPGTRLPRNASVAGLPDWPVCIIIVLYVYAKLKHNTLGHLFILNFKHLILNKLSFVTMLFTITKPEV